MYVLATRQTWQNSWHFSPSTFWGSLISDLVTFGIIEPTLVQVWKLWGSRWGWHIHQCLSVMYLYSTFSHHSDHPLHLQCRFWPVLTKVIIDGLFGIWSIGRHWILVGIALKLRRLWYTFVWCWSKLPMRIFFNSSRNLCVCTILLQMEHEYSFQKNGPGIYYTQSIFLRIWIQ